MNSDCSEIGATCPAPGGTCGCPGGDDAWGKSCGVSTGLGTLNPGGSIPPVTGKLPTAGETNWFQITFAGNANPAYHPLITISGDAGIVFAVYATCGGGAIGCADGVGSGLTAWEELYTAGDPTVYPVSGSHFQPIPAVGTVIIEVYRSSGVATCNNYTLSISD